ncbi:MAG: histone deacetylase superfamily [Deltaproteobacteria bacterium]|nr:histone deacetylase superfamily [Deltaproteobacteria bacterium]
MHFILILQSFRDFCLPILFLIFHRKGTIIVPKEDDMNVGIVRDEIFLEHITDDYHPENPNRLKYIYAMLNSIDKDGIIYAAPRVATHEEIALIHDPAYISSIAATDGKMQRRLDPDTVTSPKSYEAACLAAGGVLQLADMLFAGEIQNGFALVRPPGHHAERNKAMGFCLFNNIAIGARYLEKKYGLKRIAIVDFDLHHGNGTQHSFYEDSSILYFSTHQYPYYPGTGWYNETGEGNGKGYTINIPLSYGMGDDDYEYAFREVLIPITEQYKPEAVLVSAGFDSYYNDPLGGMAVTEGGFATMTRILTEIADKYCNGKVLCSLEGGYDLNGLTTSVKAVTMELKGTPMYTPDKQINPSNEIKEIIGKVKQVLKSFWGDF